MKQLFKITLLVAGTAAVSLPALATPFTLNTGISKSTGLQLPANSGEERYTVTGAGAPAYVFPSGTWPLTPGTWVPNFAGPSGGQWISPVNNAGGSDPVGITTYSISFWLPSAQSISGNFTGDNPAQLSLNGTIKYTQLGWPNPNWSDAYTWGTLTPFSLSLPAGNNTVVFEVYNGGGPAGLIVDSTSVNVPDGGSTCALLGMSLLGVGALRRKLNRA